MKYRILLLLSLLCAIMVAAISGTHANYTESAGYSLSIQAAETTAKPYTDSTQAKPDENDALHENTQIGSDEQPGITAEELPSAYESQPQEATQN